MNEITINERFERFLPPLHEEEFTALERNILENGIREPIKIWRDQIIDGHNRFTIATRHDLGFRIEDMTPLLADEAEVLDWIAETQLARRNIDAPTRTLLLGHLYNSMKGRPGGHGGNAAETLAKGHNVSERKITRAGKIAEAVEKGKGALKEKFLKREISAKDVLKAVEKAVTELKPPTPEPAPETSLTDSFTEAAKTLGTRTQTLLTKMEENINDIYTLFGQHGLALRDFAPEIVALGDTLDPPKQAAYLLKELVKCPFPDAGCDHCKGNEYITQGQYETLKPYLDEARTVDSIGEAA